MSRKLPYLSVNLCKISPCHSMLAFTMDTTGTERYTGYLEDSAHIRAIGLALEPLVR